MKQKKCYNTTQHNTRLLACVHVSLGKLVSESTISGFPATDDGGGSGDNWNSTTCEAPVNSPSSTSSFSRAFHSVPLVGRQKGHLVGITFGVGLLVMTI